MLGMSVIIQSVNEKVQEDRPQGYLKRSRGNSAWNLLFEQSLKYLLNMRASYRLPLPSYSAPNNMYTGHRVCSRYKRMTSNSDMYILCRELQG